jgi:hypothetical protein
MKAYPFISIFFIISLFFLSSCIDKDKRPDYYFKFKVDGVQKSFKASTDAVIVLDDPRSNDKRNILNMVSSSDIEKNSIVIVIRVNRVEVGQDYILQEAVILNGATLPQVAIAYWDENKIVYGASLLKSISPDALDDAVVTLTKFTTEGGYGTFSGILFKSLDEGPIGMRKPIVISEGEFYLPVIRNYAID